MKLKCCRAVYIAILVTNGANVFRFLSSLPLLSSSLHGSVWVLPVISLLLTNTVSPVRACLDCGMWTRYFEDEERFSESLR